MTTETIDTIGREYKFGFHDREDYVFKAKRGLNRATVEEISWMKGEPDWMRDFRLRSLEIFERKPMPTWGGDLSEIDFQNMFYYIKPSEKQAKSWEDVPEYIKNTFDKLGIPQAERKFLAGVGAQYESEVVYHSLRADLEKLGVIFVDCDTGLREHPEIFKEYFGKLIPPADNKFAALNSAVWSGGSFVYVPAGVKVEIPLQAYFRINAENMGQFERTLIIAEEGSFVHYIEGCFLAGARVRTRTGEKLIEDIQVGDEVLTHKGRYRQVYRTMKRPYHGMVYRLRYYGDSGQELQVTAEHPLLVVPRERARNRNRAFTPEWLTAAQVRPGDYLAIPVPQPEKVARSRTVAVPVGRGRHAPVVRNVALPLEADFFRLLGYYATTATKRVPEYVRHAPLEELAAWVRGLWNGDGSYDERKNMFRLNTVVRELAYAFRDALLRLGVAASVNQQQRVAPRQPMYAVVVSSPWNARFGEIVGRPAPDGQQSGSPFYLDDQYLYVPVHSCTGEEVEAPVYNMSVEEDESYVCEGVVSHNCTAPIYSSDSLHSAVVEIVVKKGARVRYSTIQNWSTNVYNLVTKRSAAYQDATMEWVDGNLGSRLTMKYPSIFLMEPGAKGEILSVAFAGRGQHQDAGGKVVHAAPHTSSTIVSKSVSKDGGRTSYRGLLKVYPECEGVRSNVRCDALLLDPASRSDTYPYIEIEEENVNIGHEATVSKVGEEQLFYLMSRGLSEADAYTMIVNGFIEPIAKELPLEYAVELNRLIQLQMEGSVG